MKKTIAYFFNIEEELICKLKRIDKYFMQFIFMNENYRGKGYIGNFNEIHFRSANVPDCHCCHIYLPGEDKTNDSDKIRVKKIFFTKNKNYLIKKKDLD